MSYVSRIVIFGATGRTGVCCCEAALNSGLIVTAFVRDASRLPQELASRVSVMTGDATNPQDVDDAIMGQDGVIIALGTGLDTKPSTVMSEGTHNIMCSMQKYGVNKVTICLSTFLLWNPEQIPPQYYYVNEEHKRMLESCRQSSCDWVAVCAPQITDEPGRGDYLVGEAERVGSRISKHDLAHFLVESLADDSRCCKMFAVADRG